MSRERSRRSVRGRRAGRSEPRSIWARSEPAARRPAHSRDAIARAALRIADAEGFDALTMRRVASELGAGTMTLYHYVRTKDELLALVDNALMGELLIPAGELPEGWRAGIGEIARRTRDVFVRHPWVVEMPKNVDDGPNGTLHFEQSLAVMAQTGLPPAERLELIVLVDDYVFGYVERFNPIHEFLGERPTRLAERYSGELAARLAKLDPDTFPNLHALLADEEPGDALVRLLDLALDPARFDRGLELVLDGIAQHVERAARNDDVP